MKQVNQFRKFVVSVKHDDGILHMTAHAFSPESATDRVINAENCPPSAVQSVCEFVPVEKIKRGDYVKRKADAKTVYIRDDYNRESKRYSLRDTNDMSRWVHVKKGTELIIGFEY